MNLEKERIAIERLRAFEPEAEPYWLCYSGGKDSDVIRILAQLAGVRHEIHHNLTSVDAPETIYYIRSIPDVHIDIPHDKNGDRISMWSLIVKKGIPPQRNRRYCCEALKEQGGKYRKKIIGVRAAESRGRAERSGLVNIVGKPKTVQRTAESFGAKYEINNTGGLVMNMDNDENRRLVEHCYRTASVMVNPIIDWTDSDVWEFLRHYGCEANPLYQCGLKRIGCIGCPMQTSRRMIQEFDLYPKYKDLYIRTFYKMLKEHPERNYTWKSGIEVFDWWTGFDSNQLTFDI
ncbi:MAG: phosphoadenosine phosphosulfate reductase family protein [Ruminococcus flavefaciens]|nr:phosphoadenosine phosphosulfate reductase family protein [Ruminococcus flavefaciens]